MAGILNRSTSKITFTLLMLALLFAVTAQRAAASDGAEKKSKGVTESATLATTGAAAKQSAPTIASAAFSAAMTPLPEAVYKGTLAQVGTSRKVVPAVPAGTPLPPRAPATSTAPMTAGEKFKTFVKKSIGTPAPYALSISGGLLGEALDNDHGRHMTTGDFMADSMTHAARSFGFRITANFFEKFAFATILHQDIRYHRSDQKGTGGKAWRAVRGVFVTQGDRCGCDQFNASFLMGGLTASAIAQSWRREEDRTTSKIFTSWGTHVAVKIFTNLLTEFIGGQ